MSPRALAAAWALALVVAVWPWPCAIPQCSPVVYDEGVLLSDAYDLARHGFADMAPSYMGRPLHRVLLAGAFRAVGPAPWAGALVSSVSAALCIVLTFSIGRRLGGDRVGLTAAALLAASNLLGHYARTAYAECDALLFFLLALRALVIRCARSTEGDLTATDFAVAGLWMGLAVAANPRIALAAPWLALVGMGRPTFARVAARLGLATSVVAPGLLEGITRLAMRQESNFGTYASLNAGYFRPGSLFDYPVFMVVCEGPVLTGLAVLAVVMLLRRPGLERDVAATGPVASYLVAALAFGHHALRYLVVYMPGLALAVALAAPRHRLSSPVVLGVCAACVFTRASLPRGNETVYPQVVSVLERVHAKTVLATHVAVIGALRELSGATDPTFVPMPRASQMQAQIDAGATHCVRDFERWFLYDYVRGVIRPDTESALLLKPLQPLLIDNPVARGPYLWFEHGIVSPPPDLEGFDRIEIYDLRPLKRGG